ncbi:MAG: cobyrinate a,c-diamide synthase [Desulfonauticus sp.]|nr:cobyrinate a,c-diamide synthase [Desulfonauticus sp.]
MRHSIMLAGIASGCGKTSLSMALIAALGKRGFEVFPYKVGPDYLDPMYLRWAAQKDCLNLDLFFAPLEHLKSLLQPSGLNVIEGVMGYYDGDKQGQNSCADLALSLDIPVLLIVNPFKMAQSFAALIYGFVHFKTAGKQIKGIILNNYTSEKQKKLFATYLQQNDLPPLIGAIPSGLLPNLLSRYLGLKSEIKLSSEDLDKFAQTAEKYLDLNFILNQIIQIKTIKTQNYASISQKSTKRCVLTETNVKIKTRKPVLVVLKDKIFNFYYLANLQALAKAGVKLVFASISDQLPSKVDGIFLGGGYPELYAKELSQEQKFIQWLKSFAWDGGKIYAECGGLIFLSKGIVVNNQKYAFAGLVPYWTELHSKLVRLGYVQVRLVQDAGWLAQNMTLRGHEFHYSKLLVSEADLLNQKNISNVYEVVDSQNNKVNTFGLKVNNVLASFVHLYFAHDQKVVQHMVNFLTQK